MREMTYDPVMHGQEHYRVILDCMARPGKVDSFFAISVNPPEGFNRSSAIVALTLLSAEVGFHVSGDREPIVRYLIANTRAVDVSAEMADFVFEEGTVTPGCVPLIKTGDLRYPESGATLVLSVESFASEPQPDSIRLQLEGPGINQSRTVFVRGLSQAIVEALREKNQEYPLGVDTILCGETENNVSILCLPRSTRVSWQALP